MAELSGWGRFPRVDCTVARPRDAAALTALVAAQAARGASVVARGNGRSYGDSALSASGTIDMRGFDRFLSFDTDTGQLVAEAGVLLGDVIDTFLPRGWFPSVTPGTKFVTLGGAIAADVHGKNHHSEGSFGAFTDWIDLLGPDGEVRRCSRTENAELFGWTLGGMGLTGIILRAAIRLRRVATGWIRQHTVAAPNLDAAIAAFEGAMDATYSVAWIDCVARGPDLGRSLVMTGEHALPEDLPPRHRAAPLAVPRHRGPSVPIDAPAFALNRYTVRAFNALYWRMGLRKTGDTLVDWDAYFYPLDAIGGWNRIYGRRGFVQFQCVVPQSAAREGLHALLARIADSGLASFLSVLKRFGPQDSPVSFPMEGYTLALDFPRTPRTLALLTDLDRITLDHGGRFYLAKDARMSADTLRASDPRMARLAQARRESGAARVFASLQSQRLGL
jgi:FAD/FMN-containing dehydrogenase